eukprot:232670_1
MASGSESQDDMDPGKPNDDDNIIIDNRYLLIKSSEYKIGTGRFHDTYYGIDRSTHQHFAIKYNHHNNRHEDAYLRWQYAHYLKMKSGIGIPNIHWHGEINGYKIIVMDLFDATLQQLFDFCDQRFSFKTILTIANKLLTTIEHIHTRKCLYRNINPIHFCLKKNDIYFVGFGNVNYYINPRTQRHLPCTEYQSKDKTKTMRNVQRYASINEHLGYQLSRRDDLESIGNVLLYFLYKGKLPWSGLDSSDSVANKKMTILIQDLCKDFPKQFEIYMRYCRDLQFENKPNYDYLRKLFKDLYHKNGYNKEEFVWDWDQKKLVLISAYCRHLQLGVSKDVVKLISEYVVPVFRNSYQRNNHHQVKHDVV